MEAVPIGFESEGHHVATLHELPIGVDTRQFSKAEQGEFQDPRMRLHRTDYELRAEHEARRVP